MGVIYYVNLIIKEMKRLSFIVLFLALHFTVVAQNVQLHYDFGHSLYKELGKSELSYGRP